MSELDIKIMGEPNLIQPSSLVTKLDQSITELVQDLKDTLIKRSGVGISAPQIGVNKRVIVFGFNKNERYPTQKSVPLTVLINPEYDVLSDKLISDWEGCLSVPGMRGLVPRYERIQYRGYDDNGNLIERTVEGFHARIIQHEIDHLDGILFPFRIKDLTQFGFESILLNKIYEEKETTG